MLGVVKRGNVLQNIIMYYNDVEISIAFKSVELPEGKVMRINVDSIKLYCKNGGGDITDLYLHSGYMSDGMIYVDDGDELLDELQSIIKFIDKLNEFKHHVRNYDPRAE